MSNQIDAESILRVDDQDDDELDRKEIIECCHRVEDLVRGTYGPYGRAKMIVNHVGEKHVTTSGSFILDNVGITHPAGHLFVDTFGRDRVHDGATFGTLMTTSLVSEAEQLIKRGVSPPTIVRGYRDALERASEVIDDIAIDVSLNAELEYALARTAVEQFGEGETEQHLCNVMVDAVRTVGDGVRVSDIHFEEDIRLTVDDSRVVAGTLVRTDPLTDPGTIDDADILLVDSGFVDRSEPEYLEDATVTGDTYGAIVGVDTASTEAWVDAVLASGADVVVSKGQIPSEIKLPLEERGLLLAENIDDTDFERIQTAVGGNSTVPGEIDGTALGTAGQVRVSDHGAGTKPSLIFGDCADPNTATIIVNGGTGSVTDHTKQWLKSGIEVLSAARRELQVIPGAGATEIEIANRLRDVETGARRQLAIDGFADALERILRILATNSGLDPNLAVSNLRSAHRDSPDEGIDLDDGGTFDTFSMGVLEPRSLKHERLGAATELAVCILQIDDVIAMS